MRTKAADSTLSVSNINVVIKDKEILKNVRTEAKSGDLLAILGPTGSGKTTLLNVISGRLKYNSGEISLNGQPFNKRLRRRLAFVQQQDVFFSQLTLWETLYFTAQIRLPDSYTAAQKRERVQEIIETLDMKKCQDTIIGDIFVRGLSGGEKKRASIACELLTDPDILLMDKTQISQLPQELSDLVLLCLLIDIWHIFVRGLSDGEKKRASIACELLTDPDILLMDEPTSGLDSSTAGSIMALMKSYANNFNKTIITTIHQPSSQIYHLFNNILLLVNGQEAYFGPARKAMDYFSSIGLPCELDFNPADFLLQVVKSDEQTVLKIVMEAERKRNAVLASSMTSLDHVANGVTNDTNSVETNHVAKHEDVKVLINGEDKDVQLSLIQNKESSPEELDASTRDRWVTSWLTQYKMLSWRSFKQTKGQLKQGYLIVQTCIITLVIGLIYWQTGVSMSTVRDVQGLLFFVLAYWSFNTALEQISGFLAEKAVVAKERASGSYRLSAYYAAKSTADLGLILILPSFQYLLLYLFSGIGGVAKFFYTWPLVLLQVPLAQAVGLLIVTIFVNLKPAMTAMASYMLSSFMIGGFFTQSIPFWLEWGKYLSIMLYGFGAANLIIFGDMEPTLCNVTATVEYTQCRENGTEYIYAEDVIHNAGVYLQVPCYVSMMVIVTCIVRVIGYFVLRYKRQVLL